MVLSMNTVDGKGEKSFHYLCNYVECIIKYNFK